MEEKWKEVYNNWINFIYKAICQKSRRIYSLSLSIVPLYLLRCVVHARLTMYRWCWCVCARGKKHIYNHTAFSLPSKTIPVVTQPCVPFSPPLMHPPKLVFFILPPNQTKETQSPILNFIPLMKWCPAFGCTHTHTLDNISGHGLWPFLLVTPFNSLAIKACCSLCQKYRYADHSPIPMLAVTHMLLLSTSSYMHDQVTHF